MEILSVLNAVLSVVIGLLLLVFLVVVHELGHAIVARRNGVVVEEFGIGFPPRAWARKLKNGILFTMNWLPLGGFVKLQGENDSASNPGDYGAASYWSKTKILFAGVVMNWAIAIILFSVLAVTGLPKFFDWQYQFAGDTREVTSAVQVSYIEPGFPADEAGIERRDEIVSVGDVAINSATDLSDATEQLNGSTVPVTFIDNDNGETRTVQVALRDENSDGKGYIGVAPFQQTLLKSTYSAPIVGVVTTAQLTGFTVVELGKLLGNLVTGFFQQFSTNDQVSDRGSDKIDAVSNNVAGPIGILGVIFPAAREAGLTSLLTLTAIVSLTLAVMNTLPIPALDGGRWFVTTLYKVLRKPLSKDTEERIHGTGFLILIGLIILITIADIGKLGG